MHNKTKDVKVCPVESAGGLDSRIRKLIHKPEKILKPYIVPGITALDLGCGPGLFTIAIAQLLEGKGKVIAADLQQGMLDKVNKKIRGTGLEQLISLHKCQEDSISLTEKVDFILAFYMVHEVVDHGKLFSEFKQILNPGGRILIIEPYFHVTKKSFNKMTDICIQLGFEPLSRPKVFFSRTVLFRYP